MVNEGYAFQAQYALLTSKGALGDGTFVPSTHRGCVRMEDWNGIRCAGQYVSRYMQCLVG